MATTEFDTEGVVQFQTEPHTIIYDKDSKINEGHDYAICIGDEVLQTIDFQKGARKGYGPNGIFIEDLLAIAANELVRHQTGKFPCEENEKALESVLDALKQLNIRTAKRRARGVEGKEKE